MTAKLSEVQMALEHAFDHSQRKGKWSTVPDVKKFESDASLTKLRDLVKQGAAKEKSLDGTALKLFKPTRAGGGGSGVVTLGKDEKPGDRSESKPGGNGRTYYHAPGGYSKPKDKPRRKGRSKNSQKTNKTARTKPGKRSQDNLRNTLGAGIGMILVGGTGSSMGGAQATGPTITAFR